MKEEEREWKGLWKFNNSLALNSEFVDKMKAHIANTQKNVNKENISGDQATWIFKIWNQNIFNQIIKVVAKKYENSNFISWVKTKIIRMHCKLLDNSEYISCKSKLDQFYEEKANDIRIRSKCDWYEYIEKSTKFFINLEKIRAHQKKIRNILKNGKEITDQKEVNSELFDFYNNLFKSDKRSSKYDIVQFLSSFQVPHLTEEQSAKCEILISEDELICILKKMPKINHLVMMV